MSLKVVLRPTPLQVIRTILRWAAKGHKAMKEFAYVQSGALAADVAAMQNAWLAGRPRPELLADKWFAKENTNG